MKTARNIIIIICAAALLLALSASGVIVYYYFHPAKVKDLVKTALARATGTSMTIQQLSYTLDPLRITATGISLKPAAAGSGFHLDVSEFYAEGFVEGSVGRKTLIIKRLKIDGLTGRISRHATFGGTRQTSPQTSYASRMLKGAFGFFLFRDVALKGASMTDGSVDAQWEDQELHIQDMEARLSPDHRVEISCHIDYHWPSKQIRLHAPSVLIKTDEAISLVNPRISGAAAFDGIRIETPEAVFKNVRAGSNLVYAVDKGLLEFDQTELVLDKMDVKMGGGKEVVHLNLNLAAAGELNVNTHELTTRSFQVKMSPHLQLSAKLTVDFGAHQKIRVTSIDSEWAPQELLAKAPVSLRKALPPLKISGPLHVTGRLEGLRAKDTWTWDADIKTHLKENSISFDAPDTHASGLITGVIEVQGHLPNLKISADMTFEQSRLSVSGIETEPFEATAAFAGTYPVFHLKGLSASIPHAGADFKGHVYALDEIQVRVPKGQLNASTRAFSLPEIKFDSSVLKNLKATLKGGDGIIRAGIQGKEAGLIELCHTLDLVPPGWQLTARDTIQANIQVDENKSISIRSQLDFDDLGFQDPEAVYIAEKLSLKTEIEGRADALFHDMTVDLALHAAQGEMLLDRFYINLNKYPLSSRFNGGYNTQKKRLQFSELRLGLKNVVDCQMSGEVMARPSGPDLAITASIPPVSVKPMFRLFLVEPFQAEKPLFAAMDVEGDVSAQINLEGTREKWRATGRVQWDGGKMTSQGGEIALNGIDLVLPVWFQSHEEETSGDNNKGKLSIASAELPYIPEQGLTLSLAADPNRLTIPTPTVIRIPGGKARVGPVTVQGRLGAFPSVRTYLAMENVDLAPLLSDIWPKPIQGSLYGRLDPVHFESGALTSHGELTADVFGGQIILSEPGMSHILAGTPVFKLNARFDDLNLSEITAETSFGKIEGILNGYAKHLEIAQGQLQKFDLRLETVKKEDVSQRISVRAVDNIAQIGGGQSPFVGVAGMFASVFKEFPYEKIGVRATLENDVFRINGTIHEGGVEYLVKRGLLSGVNVVNQNPDNRVSFKDMVKRIKRVTSSKSGPVIK